MNDDDMTCPTAGQEAFLELYRIQPGIPFDRALEEVSMLVGCVRHLTCEAEMENDALALSAARYLSAFSKALINDMESARQRAR